MYIYVFDDYVCLQWRTRWPCCLRHGSAAAGLLGFRFRIPPETCLSVCCECCSGSVRCLCDGQNPLSEEFYRVWCVWVWSRNRMWCIWLWSRNSLRCVWLWSRNTVRCVWLWSRKSAVCLIVISKQWGVSDCDLEEFRVSKCVLERLWRLWVCDLKRECGVSEYDLETEFAVSECDLETSTVCRPRPTMGSQAM